MYLTYFDDTGGTGQNYADAQQPVQGLCSVSIDESKWQSVEKDCRNIVAKYFPSQIDSFLKSKTFELHAAAIYHGVGAFRQLPFSERLQLLYDIVEIIVANELPVTGVYVEKDRAAEILPQFSRVEGVDNLDNLLFIMLYVHLDVHLAISDGPNRTILIGDHDSVKPGQAEQFEDLFNQSDARGGHVLESVRFVDSHRSFGIQLADAAAYLVRRSITHPDHGFPAIEHLKGWLHSGLIEDQLGILRIHGGWVKVK